MANDDELLAIRCQLGETDAFDALIARWHDAIWSYARRVCGSAHEADDVAQDVWMRVIRGLPRLKEPARFRAWVFGIARRVLMDRFRAQYASPVAPDVEVADLAAAGQDADTDIERDLREMHDEMAHLPVIERDVLALFYLQELSLADIADVMGVPVGTVKSRLHRARRLLHARLTKR